MIFPVYPYFLDKTKEYSSHPKIYFSDVGILSFLERSYGDKTSNGRTVENFVFWELLKSKQSTYDEIKTYKKLTKSEIDFIYEYTNDTIVPIEVKSGNNRAIPRIFHTIHSDIPHTEACIQTSFSLYQYQPLEHLDYYQIPNCLIWKVPEMLRKRVL